MNAFNLAFIAFVCLFNTSFCCFTLIGSSDSSTALNGVDCPNNRQANSTSSLSKIVGGTESPRGQYPWQAFITDGSYLCGAALINTQWLVTAAHCSFNLPTWNVYLGDHNIQQSDGETRYKVASFIQHPSYNGATFDNDIALLKLESTVTMTARVQPISLPGGQSPTTGNKAVVAGWGTTSEDGSPSAVLMHVAVCIQDANVCGSNSAIAICAGVTQSPVRDSCQGDSGGPLIVNGTSGNYYLAGVVSSGVGCRGRGVYTKVSTFESWIATTIANNS